MKHNKIASLSGGDEHTQNRKDFIIETMHRSDITDEMKVFTIEAHWAMSLVMRGINTTKRAQDMISGTIIEKI